MLLNHRVPTKHQRISVCLVAHNAYGAISGGRSGFIGGVEWQTAVLARFLSEQGHRVTVLTWDEGGGAKEHISGVRVLKICRADAGMPGLRFFVPKWTSLTAALAKADADVYFHNCSECVTGQVALWCKSHGRAFVFSLASNADCIPQLPEMRSMHERILYRIGLRRASHIIAQTVSQQRQLREGWGLDAEVIPMACPGPEGSDLGPRSCSRGRVLWVGRVCAVKRVEAFLDLAVECPDLIFDIVGPFGDDPYSFGIRSRAALIPNVVVHGRVTKQQIAQYYRDATVLCCTSRYEGFPNTFLEAWSYGVPVVSTFDPDSIIVRYGLGAYAERPADLREPLRRLLRDKAAYEAMSRRVRHYYEQNHTPELVLPRFECALQRVARHADHCACVPST